MKTSMLRVCSLFAFALMAGGCASTSSMRFSTTLKPRPDPGPIFGEVRFCIGEVKVKDDKPPEWLFMAAGPVTAAPLFGPDNVAAFRQTAQQLYPSLFSDDILSIPLTVNIQRENTTTPDGLMFIFPGLFGILPVYEGRKSVYSVEIDSPVPKQSSAPVTFIRRDAAWTTLLTPLALIPVVGHSDAPRRSWSELWMPKRVIQTGEDLTYGSLSEAARQQLSALEEPEVYRVSGERSDRLRTGIVNGRTLWLWEYSDKGVLHVCVFAERPTYSKWAPLDDIVFHPGSDGTCPPVFMRRPPYFTEISVRIQAGRVLTEAQAATPALSQLLELVKPNAGGAAALDDDALIAAVTPALVCAKNTELPTLVVQASVDKRVAILNAIEQRLLEAQQHLVLLNGRAEDAVRQGQNAADFRQKTARIQAYMSVLAEIKNLLMQS